MGSIKITNNCNNIDKEIIILKDKVGFYTCIVINNVYTDVGLTLSWRVAHRCVVDDFNMFI